MRRLSRTTAEDIQMNIYGKRSVQIVINEHWDRTYIYIIAFLFVPYIAMLIVYTIWANFSLQKTEEWTVEYGDVLLNILFIMSMYFLLFEFIQFVSQPISFLLEGWSYIKTIPMLLVLYNTTIRQTEYEKVVFWQR